MALNLSELGSNHTISKNAGQKLIAADLKGTAFKICFNRRKTQMLISSI